MKTTLPIGCAIIFASCLLLQSCNSNSKKHDVSSNDSVATDKPKVNSEREGKLPLTLVSQLVFESRLASDKATIVETRSIYSTLQNQSNSLLAGGLGGHSFDMSVRGITVCPCPQAVINCPCPRSDSTTFVAPADAKALMFIGTEKLNGKIVEDQNRNKWQTFNLPSNLSEGTHKMKIEGIFIQGGNSKPYEFSITVKDGKIYPVW